MYFVTIYEIFPIKIPQIVKYYQVKRFSIEGWHEFLGFLSPETGGRLNKKDGLTRYGNSHVKDKTS